MKKDCIFCQIAFHKIPAKIRYEDKKLIAFDDINPKAPIHILILPKKHFQSINQLGEKNKNLIANLLLTATKITKKLNISESGFKIIINTGKDGGQSVPHLHLHLLGGKINKSINI